MQSHENVGNHTITLGAPYNIDKDLGPGQHV